MVEPGGHAIHVSSRKPKSRTKKDSMEAFDVGLLQSGDLWAIHALSLVTGLLDPCPVSSMLTTLSGRLGEAHAKPGNWVLCSHRL